MIKRIRQTNNPILRVWGNACSYIGAFFLNQADKYCDLYDMTEMLSTLEQIDNTIAWQEDD